MQVQMRIAVGNIDRFNRIFNYKKLKDKEITFDRKSEL
jgi:hypothetical protein